MILTRSLLSLVQNSCAGWREFIDLEHNITYSPENHWNADIAGEPRYETKVAAMAPAPDRSFLRAGRAFPEEWKIGAAAGGF